MATKVKLIETGAVTGNIIPDGGIATGKLADDAVTTIKISDANITHAKLHTSMDLTGKTVTVATAAGSTNTTAAASTAFVQQELTTLIGGAPSTLNDLNELAAAINDDANYNSTLTTALATKLPLAGGTMTGELGIGVTPGAWSANYPALQIGQGATFTGHISNTQTQLGQNWWVGTGNQYVVNGAASRLVMGADSSITFSQAPSGTAGATMSSITNPLVINASGNATFAGTITATNLGQHQIATTLFAENIIKSSKATEAGGYIRMASSTQSVPTYTFVDDTNTGMFTSGADTLNFTTGGTERLRIDSGGRLLLGTSTPRANSGEIATVNHSWCTCT